ncbi:MAG: ribose-phosphate diphosphokinase [Candidatus Methanoperedens sp.]|nr:ribose-phosphate diphosphokinase [Candidatus Methanoperedens sp.]MCZ7369822.1 ribose-phosphate diphosphokinase [Candidatus Methanoperedens sp.]
MNIIGGHASQLLAGRVSDALKSNLLVCEFRKFPDGELYTRILDEIGTDDVTIIQSTVTDSDFVMLLQLIDACSDAARINVVIPYMGYARQDKRFKEGEPISARAIARAINVDNIYTINIHDPGILDHFDAKAVNLDATPVMGKYIKNMDLKNPLIIAPDEGAIGLATNAARDLGLDYDFLEKTRLSGELVTIKPKNVAVKGRDVIIIDDIISTAGTMAETISLLRNQGAHEVYVACVHPVLSSNAILKLFKAGVKGIMATDTIDRGVSVISVAPVVAEAIKNI